MSVTIPTIPEALARGAGASDLLGGLKAGTAIDLARATTQATQAETAERQALTARQQAELPYVGAQMAAQTAQYQAQARGMAVDAALKQRHLDAYNVLGNLMQKHTAQNPDGTRSTDWGSVMGEYTSQYPDYAIELQNSLLDREKKETDLNKSHLDLAGSQIARLGTIGTTGGFDSSNIAKDPQLKDKYAAWYQQVTQEGIPAAQLGMPTPNEFNQNPQAYIPNLNRLVLGSNGAAAGIKQRGEIAQAQYDQTMLAKKRYADLLNGGTPQAQAYELVKGQTDPQIFAQANLPPPNTITSPEAEAHNRDNANQALLTPEQRVTTAENKRHDIQSEVAAQTAARGGLMRGQAAAMESGVPIIGPAGAPAGGGGAPSPAGALPTGPAGGAPLRPAGTPAGTPPAAGGGGTAAAAPPAGAPAANALMVNSPTQGRMDLNQFGPWQAETNPVVRQRALALLSGNEAMPKAGTKSYLSDRAVNLATKIDPNLEDHIASRKKFLSDNSQTITSGNATIQHSDELADYARHLNQRLPGFLNAKLADLRGQSPGLRGDEQAEFENRRDKYVTELERYLHGGTFTEGEANKALEHLGNAKTVGQLLAVIRDNNQMIAQKANVLNRQYNEQYAGNILGGGIDVLQPETKVVLRRQGVPLPKIPVQIPGHGIDYIDESQVQRLKQKYPNAVVLRQ